MPFLHTDFLPKDISKRSWARPAPTACMHPVSGSVSLPSQGYFSPFPHGTGSLSVSGEYLALEDGPPSSKDSSDRVSRAPPYSISRNGRFRVRGYHPLWRTFPGASANDPKRLRAGPLSLVTTQGISVDFFSSGYLDISVPRVRFANLCIQLTITPKRSWVSPFGDPRIRAC